MKIAVTIGLCLAMVFMSAWESPAGLNDGLAAYYPFNGNADDESGNNNNGTVNGAALTTDRLENPNSAYNFNGSTNYILINDNNTFHFSSSFSISAWVYPNSTSAIYMDILHKWANSTTGVGARCYGLYLTDRKASLVISSDGKNDIPTVGATALSVDNWHHVVGVYNGNSMMVYTDGILDGSDSYAGSIYSGTANITIGRDGFGNYPFKGKIDDIRVYNRALSATEIQELYNGNCSYTDSDNDGVIDQWDECPDTPSGSPVDKNGCPYTLGDINGDKKVGLSEAIHALQVTSGIKPAK